MKTDRRGFLATGALLAATPALPASARPRRPRVPIGTGGTPTAPVRLAEIARKVGDGEALTFLDLAAFDANLARYLELARSQGWGIRPALKSLQSPAFADYALRRLPAPRGLVFHLRAVDPLLRLAPAGTDLMLGYPPSPAELEAFLASAPPRRRHRVRILVDSLELLERLARAPRRRRVEVALQLESGFELSALRTPGELTAALELIRANRRTLKLTAVMCYDGHAAFQPPEAFRRSVVLDAERRFAAWNAQLRAEAGDVCDLDALVRNGPASSSCGLWAGSPEPNEISPGAGLLFHGYITEDGHDNAGLAPTLHHAAPVHRVGKAFVPLASTPDPQGVGKDAISCKGGAWPSNTGSLAAPVHPPGLAEDELSGGRGNNQSNFLAPEGTVARGDYVVLRPKHAGDAVDHFGALIAVRDGRPRRVWATQSRQGRVRL